MFKIDDYVKYEHFGKICFGVIKKVTAKNLRVIDISTLDTVTISKDKAEVLPPIHLDKKTYKKLARFDIPLSAVVKDNVFDNIVNDDNYVISLNDIREVLVKLDSGKFDQETVYDEWFCYFDDIIQDTVYQNADTCFYNSNTVLERAYELISEYLLFDFDIDYDFSEMIAEIDFYSEDESKPLAERRIPDYAKELLVSMLNEDENLKTASPDEVKLYQKFSKELCERGEIPGLLAVGYGCYGGNRAFGCDWKKSEECMLKLIDVVDDVTDRAFYANTLGYIYYYGRTNNDVPEYEKAYKYFSFAAFNGVYEAQYKIADMYKNGYGVIKSPETSMNIVSRLYEENLEYIQSGDFNSKFADVALRMGSNALSVGLDYDCAVYYYYQADFAIRMRMLNTDYIGDEKVASSIKSALAEAKEKISYKPSGKIRLNSVSHIFESYLKSGHVLDVTAKALYSGNYKLTFKAHKKFRSNYQSKLFITIPELDMCGLYESLTVTVIPFAKGSLYLSEETCVIDEIRQNYFLFDGFPFFICDNCMFEIKAPKADNKKYRFVSVRFDGGEKCYDYLCDDESIKIGDIITVPANEEEKQVQVMNIFEKKENETFLPIKCYKRIGKDAK